MRRLYIVCIWGIVGLVCSLGGVVLGQSQANMSSELQEAMCGPGSGPNCGKDIPCSQMTEEQRQKDKDGPCRCGLKLLTDMPIIGQCIMKGTQRGDNSFAYLIGMMSRIVLSLIVVAAIIAVLVGSVMMIAGGANESRFGQGRGIIIKVLIGLIVLGLGGVILRIANPNFFGPDDAQALSSVSQFIV